MPGELAELLPRSCFPPTTILPASVCGGECEPGTKTITKTDAREIQNESFDSIVFSEYFLADFLSHSEVKCDK